MTEDGLRLATETMEAVIQAVDEQERRNIVEGEADEVNPWLNRAGWHTYLGGLDRAKLLAFKEPPNEKFDPVLVKIWPAMSSGSTLPAECCIPGRSFCLTGGHSNRDLSDTLSCHCSHICMRMN